MAQPAKVENENDTMSVNKDTGSDIRHLDNRLTTDIREVRGDIRHLDERLTTNINEIRLDVKRVSEKLDTKLETGLKDVRGEIKQLDTKFDAKMGKNLTWTISVLVVGFAALGILIGLDSFIR